MNDSGILLVEDNPDDVDLTLRAFRRNGLRTDVVVARDGIEAESVLFGPASNGPPALVLLDLKLPKLNGLEVLRAIRADQHTAAVPVVVLTSSIEEEDVIAAYRLGANSYIRKPVEFHSFLDVIHQLGLYWLVLNEPAPRAQV
jgi:two-component system response regulator